MSHQSTSGALIMTYHKKCLTTFSGFHPNCLWNTPLIPVLVHSEDEPITYLDCHHSLICRRLSEWKEGRQFRYGIFHNVARNFLGTERTNSEQGHASICDTNSLYYDTFQCDTSCCKEGALRFIANPVFACKLFTTLIMFIKT